MVKYRSFKSDLVNNLLLAHSKEPTFAYLLFKIQVKHEIFTDTGTYFMKFESEFDTFMTVC
jgi:hypothetical protein